MKFDYTGGIKGKCVLTINFFDNGEKAKLSIFY